MELAGLHIDRFGARSDFNLSDIAAGLNVIHGPNGSGKTTIIQFIRWMMYGQRDEVSQRYLATGHAPARGTIDVRDHRGTRRLERTNNDAAPSYLTVYGATQPMQLPTALSRSEFDRFFAICFDQPRDISDLLRWGAAQSHDSRNDRRRRERIHQLTDQVGQYRTELSQIDHISETAEQLRDRRQGKLSEIDSVRAEHHRRRDELEYQQHQVATDISEQQMLVERLRNVLVSIDTAVQNRKNNLAEEYQQWIDAQRQLGERRSRRVREIDLQVTRWQELLQQVRQRLEQVRSKITSFGEVSISPAEATDMHSFLRAIAFRMRHIEHDLHGIYEGDAWHDHEADASYLRGLLGSAANFMQDDVARLCQTIERQQQSQELSECREELNCLSRTEQELSNFIDALNRQRHQISLETEFWPSGFSTEIGDQHPSYSEAGHTLSDPTTWRSASSPALPFDLANTLNDVRLRHLIERRHAAAAPQHDAELKLSKLQRKLREIEETISGLGIDGRIAALERDVDDIDRLLEQLEERATIQRLISSLEDELRRLRDHSSQSQVIDEANAILRRLTDNEYTEIRIADGHQCQVIEFAGHAVSYELLSRGVQDRVYLSLNVAIVAAYRRKGVVVPLILNDVFGNLDESGTTQLVEFLADLAQGGQQILLFTRHEHIRQQFESKMARIFTLSGRYERIIDPTPVMEPTVFAPSFVPPTAEVPPGTPDPTYRWVAEWQRSPESHPLIPPTPAPRPEPAEQPRRIEPVKRDDEPNSEFVVSLSSLLTEVPTLDVDLIGYLNRLDIGNVEKLLVLDPGEAEVRLGRHGITAEIIKRRQREILMMVYLGVTPLEAQLLVACGVPDPERLGRADEAVLLKRIETILDRPQASVRFGSISDYSLSRVRRWIDTARRSNYPARSRRSSFHPSGASDRVSTGGSDTVRMQSKPDMKFYLEVNDPVVDAPSIGPKTAEKLNEIDIFTVRELLDLDASKIAARLDDRRISEDTVSQWQLQAQLVCCIPNLRGHDAQILVACGIEEPAILSSQDASSFLARVTEFVDSKEGQRIIRNSKKPDLAEVTAWIEWADSARQLKAA